MRTILRAIGLLLEILLWYCFGWWVYRQNHHEHKSYPEDL